ncbi:hypothetical protein [Sphingobacterium paludis]|uniref:Uncharacterized protein n=1 Tax=Sphingobacterium paludis TaxID=1476465 RepID=A0A4V6Q000_9SPHI|nr:hypothetical protein [Sphingobacterium paludis]TDS14738.1 hypothetical protein B0I21_103237 [Sphingobacterium paludis]
MSTNKSNPAFSKLIESLGKIKPETSPSVTSDGKSNEEEKIFEDGDDYEADTQKERFKRYRNNTKLRTRLAKWAVTVVSVWLIFVAMVLLINNRELCLSDSVLIALLTTTTANILGIMYIVLKDIFNGNSEK